MSGRLLPIAALLSSLAPVALAQQPQHEVIVIQTGPGQAVPGPGRPDPGAGQPVPGQPAPAPGRPGVPHGVTPPRDNQQRPDTGTARIAGRVVGGDTGAPLRRAEVGLSGEGLREGRSATTDENGRFDFKDLPPGRFQLRASKAGYVTMAFGQRRATESGRPLELADGQRIDTVQFNLPRGGVITGRITDEFGEPVAGTNVKALRYRYMDGRRQLVPVAGPWTMTDDLGRYRAYGLPPGDYIVSASSGMGGMSWGAQSESRSGFAPTYYPGTPSAGDAQRVRVAVGAEVTANFSLLPSRTFRVSGTATDSEGRPITSGVIMVQEGPPGRQAVFTMSSGAMIKPDGTFSIANLTPGEYILHVNKGGDMADGDAETTAVPIALVSEDITGLAIVTSRRAKVVGQVVFESGEPPPFKPAELQLWAMPVGPASPMYGGRFKVRDDWTFEGGAQESPVLIRGTTRQTEWRVKAVLQRGVDVTDSGVVFRPGESVDDVQIVLSNRSSVITGAVTKDGTVASREYAVVVYADDPNRWAPMSRYVGSARPDQQGQFEVKGLPAGTYLALAVEYLEEGQDRDPEFLQNMRNDATSFQLGEGERKVLNLRIVAER